MLVLGLGVTATLHPVSPAMAAIGATVAPAPGPAKPATERFEMYIGDTRVLDIDARRVAVGNGRVISVKQVEGNRLVLLGEATGASAIHVWMRDGGHRRYVVNVLEFNGELLYGQVQRLLDGTR
ncbi:MAG: pilus assembly protein N-terminal domain-containing protein, partial [Gammaproteobacteria bacterium]|nr:pilus assembly protein N-terminal domain-containing protein [Gammaproteobacteria bacterium]